MQKSHRRPGYFRALKCRKELFQTIFRTLLFLPFPANNWHKVNPAIMYVLFIFPKKATEVS